MSFSSRLPHSNEMSIMWSALCNKGQLTGKDIMKLTGLNAPETLEVINFHEKKIAGIQVDKPPEPDLTTKAKSRLKQWVQKITITRYPQAPSSW